MKIIFGYWYLYVVTFNFVSVWRKVTKVRGTYFELYFGASKIADYANKLLCMPV